MGGVFIFKVVELKSFAIFGATLCPQISIFLTILLILPIPQKYFL
jgi:hypothetical protein